MAFRRLPGPLYHSGSTVRPPHLIQNGYFAEPDAPVAVFPILDQLRRSLDPEWTDWRSGRLYGPPAILDRAPPPGGQLIQNAPAPLLPELHPLCREPRRAAAFGGAYQPEFSANLAFRSILRPLFARTRGTQVRAQVAPPPGILPQRHPRQQSGDRESRESTRIIPSKPETEFLTQRAASGTCDRAVGRSCPLVPQQHDPSNEASAGLGPEPFAATPATTFNLHNLQARGPCRGRLDRLPKPRRRQGRAGRQARRAREARAPRRAEARRHNEPTDLLTPGKEMPRIQPVGETTEAGSPEPVGGWRATRQG